MEDDDDFTFPTVVAAAPALAPTPTEGQLGGPRPVAQLLHHQLPVPDLAAASPLWPFAGSPKATAAPPSSPAHVAADEEEEARVSESSRREEKQRAEAEAEAEAEEEEEVRRAAAEERMDLLWEGATAAAPATQPTGSGTVHAEPPPKPRPNPRDTRHSEPPPKPKPNPRRAADSDDNDDKRRAAAAVADAERMDKLWESFNEELLLLRRHARSKSAADHPAGGLGPSADRWYLCNYPPSDAESEETAASSPAERRGYGCAPTMLRASSRAGGAGQFCGGSSSRPRSGRGAAAGWALLLRLFRRLFAVDKTPAPSRSHGSIYVP